MVNCELSYISGLIHTAYVQTESFVLSPRVLNKVLKLYHLVTQIEINVAKDVKWTVQNVMGGIVKPKTLVLLL